MSHKRKSVSKNTKTRIGVGMPTTLYLQEFGEILFHAFDGNVSYHVGSSLTKLKWRDVDVRLILSDTDYERMGFGDPVHSHSNSKWRSMVKAFSALGQKLTGLPIDFQIQQQSLANKQYQGERSALFTVISPATKRKK